ncbi:hypothetical protein CHUAL_007896 [Chamberlinius hualienensis]
MVLRFGSFILLLWISVIDAHRMCSHSPPKANEVIHHVHLEPFHVIRKRSADQSLRVYLHYDKSVNNLSKEKYNLINKLVLPEAVRYWEQTLMLRPNNKPIRLNRRCKTDSVFHRANNPHAYCVDGCSDVTMCGEVEIPEQHLEVCRACNSQGENCRELSDHPPGKGIENSDFVFYISALNTSRCNKKNVVAYAAHCQQEAALDRPIAGHVNLCPDSISMSPPELITVISTVKHEMLHALGFSVSLYAFYRDKNGKPLTERGANGKPPLNENDGLYQWSDRVIKRIERENWKVHDQVVSRPVQLVVTPRVMEETQRHFSCPFVEGAELEDQGGEGTALTHWEKRIFENEAMTGTHTQNPVYSRITLALMEDTGWYTPNYTLAEELMWGRNLGCDFVMKSCKDWIDTKTQRNERIDPFCKNVKRDPPHTKCTYDRRAVALCNLVQYNNELPAQYQNFDSIQGIPKEKVGWYGGSVDLADYCPYLQEFTWKAENDVKPSRGSQCEFEENNPKLAQNFALEKYGSTSRCFDHGPKMWEEFSCTQHKVWQHWGSGCYETICSEGRLNLRVLDYNYTCYQSKQILHIQLSYGNSLHIGSIVCPSCDEICGDSGMKCLAEEMPSVKPKYHQDPVPCAGQSLKTNLTSYILGILIIYYVTKSFFS